MDILHEAKEISAELIKIRRQLHTNPEVGFDTAESVRLVTRELEKIGLEPQKCGRGGVVCELGTSGKTVLIRADMDALKIREELCEDFAAQNGNMHACGHDMHTSMLLGAARILKAHENELHGRVRLMFQSAEEILEGAADMISSGVLENPVPDAALMIHVMVGVPLEAGSVIVAPKGVSAPAADMFEITVKGRAAHGSMPEKSIDPILVSAHIISALDIIRSREVSTAERAVLTFGSINAGDAANAIPDSALLRGSMRVYKDETREYMEKRICEITKGIAEAMRADADVKFTSGCPTLVNDPVLCEKLHEYMKELLGEKYALSADDMEGGSSGSEDFAYVSHKVPSVMLALCAGDSREGYKYPLHNPKAKFDEAALAVGAAVYAYSAIKLLE